MIGTQILKQRLLVKKGRKCSLQESQQQAVVLIWDQAKRDAEEPIGSAGPGHQ